MPCHENESQRGAFGYEMSRAGRTSGVSRDQLRADEEAAKDTCRRPYGSAF